MREVRTGVWQWEARHPEWNERQWWGPLVSSYAIDDGARLVLSDKAHRPVLLTVSSLGGYAQLAYSPVERFETSGWPTAKPVTAPWRQPR